MLGSVMVGSAGLQVREPPKGVVPRVRAHPMWGPVPRGSLLLAVSYPWQPASSTRWQRWGWQPTAMASATSMASSTRRSAMGGRYGGNPRLCMGPGAA